MEAVTGLYDRLVDPCLLVRRFSLDAGEILSEDLAQTSSAGQQLDLFAEQDGPKAEETKKMLEKEKKLQQALLSIKDRYGRNSVLRGMNYEEGATGKERNEQIGGHRA
jgi:DNA polymerase V